MHKPSGYSLLTSCSLINRKISQLIIEKEAVWKDLKEHVIRIINYETKPMIALTEEEKESYENQQLCHICDK